MAELSKSALLSFYKRDDVQEAIIKNGEEREVAIKFGEKGYGKRPDILRYKRDILELVMQGATSFHISEERWKNPLLLKPGMKQEDLDNNRKGWDLIIDIDCPYFEYSKHTAHLIIQFLKYYNIKAVSCKFSGNKGFHIGVPFESFPKKIGDKEIQTLFPEAPRRVAMYIHNRIKEKLAETILKMEKNDINKIVTNVGAEKNDLIIPDGNGGYNVNTDSFVDIDTVLISSRHLYRSVLSFNEKSGLVSVPINPDKVLSFERDMAQPDNLKKFNYGFLDKKDSFPGECKALFVEAFDFDFKPKNEVKTDEKTYDYEFSFEDAIPFDLFPPCIKEISKGLRDGKKRALFIISNYLINVGWNLEDVQTFLMEWNKKNPEPLRENLIISHLNYKKKNKAVLPPNCDKSIYKDLKVCHPENLCKRIKNPVNYSIIRKKASTKK